MYPSASTRIPAPANYLPSSVGARHTDTSTPAFADRVPPRDARVAWARRVEETLKQERSAVTREMTRNRDFYDGKQWTGARAPWKNAATVNYARWVIDHWTAVLTDNKPRHTYEAHNPHDQWQADIITAAWNQDATDQRYDQAKADAIQCSRISKVAYVYQTYDPHANGGEGAIVLRAIDGTDVYVDSDARDVQTASIVMIERREPLGDLLFRYKHLKDAANLRTSEYADVNGPILNAPAQSVYTNQHPTGQHLPPTSGPSARTSADQGTGGQKVLEFFTFPKGPGAQTEVSRLRFTADSRLALRRKMVEYEDGHREPLQTVVTAGHVVYELPMSIAQTARYSAEAFGGVPLESVEDAYEVIRERVSVPLYPTGRRTVVVGDCVADDGCNPFAHGRVPLAAYHAYRKGNGYYGYGDIDCIWTLQEYLNRFNALIIDAALATANPIWLIPTEAKIADEDITNAPGAIIRGESMMLKLARREPGPNLPAYVQNHLNWVVQQIKELSGLSEAATGGKFKGQQAAETVSMYQEAAGIRFRQGQRNVEAADVEIGEQYASNVKQFYTERRLVRMKDEAGIDAPIAFIGMHLDARMRVQVKPGSGLPTSPSARLNLVMQLATSSLPVYDMPALWKQLQEVGLIDSASEIEARFKRYLAQAKTDPSVLLMFPALKMLLQPPQQGGKNKGGAKKGNGGRSVRRSTPSGGAASVA